MHDSNASVKPPIVGNIPQELRERPQWLCFRLEDRGKPKPDKVPYCPANGRRADPTKIAHCGTFEDALTVLRNGRRYDGIGFVFTSDDPYCGIDFDDTADDDGNVIPEVLRWVRRLNSYAEVSLNGMGIHVIVKGTLPPKGRRKGKVEMYQDKRFFVVTGDHFPGAPRAVEDGQEELTALHAELFPVRPPAKTHGATNISSPAGLSLSDQEVLDIAFRSKNGAKIKRLYKGNYAGYDSPSEGRLALLDHLAFFTRGNRKQMARLFQTSGLMSEKWERLAEHEIDKALAGRTEFYAPSPTTSLRPPTKTDTVGMDHFHDPTAPHQDTGLAVSLDREQLQHFPLTEYGNAQRLVAGHGSDLRWCKQWNTWLVWDGQRWRRDETLEVERRAKMTVRAMYRECEQVDDKQARNEFARFILQSESRSRLASMVELAKSEPGIAVTPAHFHSSPWLFNVLNGTYDLSKDEFREHRREDMISKIAPVTYDPEATCPRFEQFMFEIMEGDEELINFIRRALGYAMTGSIEEHVLFFLHGSGRNGKGTLMELFQDLYGDYSTQTDFKAFCASKYDSAEGPRDQLASLAGVRFVGASEVRQGVQLDEAIIKSVTGGDTISCRHIRGRTFTYRPAFKIFLAGNHKPRITDPTIAMWQRLRLIPFNACFLGREDTKLAHKLREEMPGIFNWALEGCRQWRRNGLQSPDAVKVATSRYQEEEDVIGRFLRERIVILPSAECLFRDMYGAYKRWCDKNTEHAVGSRTFNALMRDHGFKDKHTEAGTAWVGVGLTTGEGYAE